MIKDPIHRWYTTVMGFSPMLVKSAIVDLECNSSGYLLDPFCGSGTTLVEGGLLDLNLIGIDANPFSSFCSRVKTEWNIDPKYLLTVTNRIVNISERLLHTKDESYFPLVVKNGWITINDWDDARNLFNAADQIQSEKYRNLLKLAILSAVKETCANIAFGPEVYRRKQFRQVSVKNAVIEKVKQIVEDLDSIQAPKEGCEIDVFLGDSRKLEFLKSSTLTKKIKWVITSPPYPTEHDYSRISRLELELGGYIKSKEDLQRIKRMQIRSNSKSIYSNDTDWKYVKDMRSVGLLVEKIKVLGQDKKYNFAHRYPDVVANYFGGLYLHLTSLADVMPKGGKCFYVLSEQRSYFGVLIPTTDIFEEIACTQLKAFKTQRRIVIQQRRGTRGTSGKIKEEAIILEKR